LFRLRGGFTKGRVVQEVVASFQFYLIDRLCRFCWYGDFIEDKELQSVWYIEADGRKVCFKTTKVEKIGHVMHSGMEETHGELEVFRVITLCG
jgi:hypothetical protein